MWNYCWYVPSCHYGSMHLPYYGQVPVNPNSFSHQIKDFGKTPFTTNIQQVTRQNNTFRTTLWTGEYLQVTLMSIDVGDDIGLEIHEDHDQFLRIEEGHGIVQMGENKEQPYFTKNVTTNSAIFVPAGVWHNLINTGNTPLKLYSIYAPPEHPKGTIHQTKTDAIAAEKDHH